MFGTAGLSYFADYLDMMQPAALLQAIDACLWRGHTALILPADPFLSIVRHRHLNPAWEPRSASHRQVVTSNPMVAFNRPWALIPIGNSVLNY